VTRRRRIALGAVGVLVALVGVAAWLLLRTPSERPFWDYVAEMKARGEPTTFEEFEGAAPPDAENAWPEIDAALADVEAQFGSEDKWPKGVAKAVYWEGRFLDPSPPGLSEAEARALAAFADGLDGFDERVAAALSRPAFQFPLVVDAAGLRDFPHLGRLPDVLRLLGVRARAATSADDRLEACRSLARLAAGMPCEDTAETASAWLALRRSVAAARDVVAANTTAAARVRERMDAALTQAWLPRIVRTTRHRAVTRVRGYTALLEGRIPSERGRLGFSTNFWERLKTARDRVVGRRVVLPRLEPGSAAELVELLEFVRAAVALDTSSYVRFHEAHSALVEERGLEWNKYPFLNYSRDLACADACARLARVALASAEFRAARGAFPTSLDDLRDVFADGVPLDPFTDAPFVYEKTPDGVRLSSRGRLAPKPALTFDAAASWGLAWDLSR
jgi:hypothetical protein